MLLLSFITRMIQWFSDASRSPHVQNRFPNFVLFTHLYYFQQIAKFDVTLSKTLQNCPLIVDPLASK